MKMDSSSDFGPVGGGFLLFHFCKKTGCFGNISFFARKYIFRVVSREGREGGEGGGQRFGKKHWGGGTERCSKKI